jgi:catechol 2,3-dioxygenase-like lactoylglutathione lyase family enzyme
VAEPRFTHLFVLVSDLEQARRFYADELGFDVLIDTPGYLRIGDRDGFYLGLEEGRPADGEGLEIVIEVDDVDRRYEELTGRGVVFEGPPADQEWGARHVWLRDPDGRRLSLYSRTSGDA